MLVIQTLYFAHSISSVSPSGIDVSSVDSQATRQESRRNL